MNYLIIGGNGYFGSKITRRLVDSGNVVVCTKRQKSDISRLIDIKEKIKWINASIEDIEIAMDEYKIDYVLNLACNYGRGSKDNDVLEANLQFPLKVLSAAIDHGIDNYLTIGSGLRPDINIYIFTKMQLGEFGKYYAEKKNINFINILLEMFYGWDEPKDRFIPSIVDKMLSGKRVETTIGTQHRDIISVDDAVKAIMMILKADIKGYCEIPVGTGMAPSISELVDFIWDETGRNSEICKGAVPMRPNEPDSVADTAYISKLGDWNPVFWKEGITKMIRKMEAKRNEITD